jgi:hypothetical protein
MTTRKEMAQKHNRKKRGKRALAAKDFCGVDGEGGNFGLLPILNHKYVLLRAGEFAIENPDGLTAMECLAFLADLPKDRIYVSYFFDYDVTMMLRSLPEERLNRLLHRELRSVPDKPARVFPLDFGTFQLDYLPGKEFRVRRMLNKKEGLPWTVISDTGTFFQTSFVNALRKWFADEPELQPVIDKIAEGKQQRNDFGEVTEYEREYNRLEIAMLERLMDKFRTLCYRLDMRPQRWQGPGNLVASVYRREGIPRNIDVSVFREQPEFREFANSAYYGGRFECGWFGEIDGPVYQYDINSAYANTYGNLPCLLHGTWRRLREGDGGSPGSVRVLDTTFDHVGNRWSLGTLPIRTRNGTIVFPLRGRGRYWSPEIDTAISHGVALTYHGGWQYESHCDCTYFDFIPEYYYERLRLGKDLVGQPIKIMLASAYGKLAQSVGAAPYANPVWSGLIVSTVRSQLVSAALLDGSGDDVYMLATDGIFTGKPRAIDVGERLGQWDCTTHSGMFIVQSGVYFLPETSERSKEKSTKTRGIPQSRLIAQEDDFRQAWSAILMGASPDSVPVTVQLRSFIGMRLALARNRIDTAGEWVSVRKNVVFDWSTKRVSPRRVGNAMQTSPMGGSPTLVSEQYSRTIGGFNLMDPREMHRLQFSDQPDWADTL